MNRIYSLATYLRQRFGRRLRKIPLDAGSGCPNRDGSISRQGCAFCNARGSGTGLATSGLSLSEQWARLASRKTPGQAVEAAPPSLIAYLQSYSNTYGPAARLANLLKEISVLPGLAAISVGTRPDCLDREKLAILAGAGIPETWLDIGLQSSDNATLARIGRGHNFACFASAVEQAATFGLKVCAHVMAGLPGEGETEFLATVRAVSALPVRGIKFHNLLVLRETALETMWRTGKYSPLTPSRYVSMLCLALTETRPDMVVHRLQADPAPGELVAPDWAGDKSALLTRIREELTNRDLWQGKAVGAQTGIPVWFDHTHGLPSTLQ
ncbi:radical SAM protein, TIGR01212 family [Desulfocurvibacter africanus PCS]|uniref:Radical SAM protein, TIGR01212 family n=1 Tax=Desulfocurvibacter africanus PCS TaxID=1262666 RepID=M5PP80_DESAF|nr:TIGR01212 family radical SAM protein [Desulfocurvibacter africanus]EMG36042.1 radical SAM protein, TIGR01212 family [Desulfocurvibacter africanus PCS]